MVTKVQSNSILLAEPALARFRLEGRVGMGPLNVELTLEPHVYLHEAELILHRGVHATAMPHGFKEGSSAAWRNLESGGDLETFSVSIWWRAIANASPEIGYDAFITVRDSRCALLKPQPGFENPARAPGRIGPPANPTDIGRIAILVEPEWNVRRPDFPVAYPLVSKRSLS
jgi:hypothetical protein